MTALDVVPRPRRAKTTGDAVSLTLPFGLAADARVDSTVIALLERLLERETNDPDATVRASEGDADVRLVLADEASDAFDDPEGYVLEVDEDGVTIKATTETGLRRGCQTLVTALSTAAEAGEGPAVDWELPACTVEDWPSTSWRGFMVDPARGYLQIDRVKRRIDQAARAKYNRLHIHLLDDEGYALESQAYPKLNQDLDGTERRAYSPADVEELVDYADRRGIEILPEVDVPAHAEHVLERYPELQCTVEDGEPADRTICIGTEETYEFVETLLEEVIELFPFDVVHIGGDEWEMHGHSWDECSACAEKMAADGSESDTEHFYAFVRHLHDFLDERDRRTMMWNDQIDISESPDLPRDIQIQFWRVAAHGRGPVEGCSMERFLEEGFEVVNSYVYAAYVRGWISEDYMLGWAPRRRPTVPADRESQVVGGELLAWEPSSVVRRKYFERALPSAIPIFADRLWNGSPVEDREEFAQSVTRHAVGPYVPDGFDMYSELGGIIAPTWWKRDVGTLLAHVNSSLGDRSAPEAETDYRKTIEMLTDLREAKEVVYGETASAYVEALEWLVEVAENESRGVLDRP